MMNELITILKNANIWLKFLIWCREQDDLINKDNEIAYINIIIKDLEKCKKMI